MEIQWIDIQDERPKRGQAIWLYDSMFGCVDSWTVMCDPNKIDADYSHWMPRKSNTKPKPPVDGLIHAAGFPAGE